MFSGVKFNILEIREGYRNMRNGAAKEKREPFCLSCRAFETTDVVAVGDGIGPIATSVHKFRY